MVSVHRLQAITQRIGSGRDLLASEIHVLRAFGNSQCAQKLSRSKWVELCEIGFEPRLHRQTFQQPQFDDRSVLAEDLMAGRIEQFSDFR